MLPTARAMVSRRGCAAVTVRSSRNGQLSAAVFANGAGKSIATPASVDSNTFVPVRARPEVPVYLNAIAPRRRSAIGTSKARASSRLSTVPWITLVVIESRVESCRLMFPPSVCAVMPRAETPASVNSTPPFTWASVGSPGPSPIELLANWRLPAIFARSGNLIGNWKRSLRATRPSPVHASVNRSSMPFTGLCAMNFRNSPSGPLASPSVITSVRWL